jgi:hypothetical protein
MAKLIGYEEKKGSFTRQGSNETVNYDNVSLYFTSKVDATLGKGLKSSTAKVKTGSLPSILPDGVQLSDLLDKELFICYEPMQLDSNGKPKAAVIESLILNDKVTPTAKHTPPNVKVSVGG